MTSRRSRDAPAGAISPIPPLFSLSEVTDTMKSFRAPLFLALPLLAACAGGGAPKPVPTAPARPRTAPSHHQQATPIPAVKVVAETAQDPHSFAHPEEVAVEHLKLDLTVDFTQRQLTGRASLRLQQPDRRHPPGARHARPRHPAGHARRRQDRGAASSSATR